MGVCDCTVCAFSEILVVERGGSFIVRYDQFEESGSSDRTV